MMQANLRRRKRCTILPPVGIGIRLAAIVYWFMQKCYRSGIIPYVRPSFQPGGKDPTITFR